MITTACFILLHVVTEIPFHNGNPFIINTAHIVSVVKTDEGNTLTLETGSLKIKETPDEVLELQRTKCGGRYEKNFISNRR